MSPDNRKRAQAGPSTSFGDVTNGSNQDKKRNRNQTPAEDVNYTSKSFLKKRKRDSSSPESNSFVSTVKTKMTNLLQASFSKWFSSPSSTKSNGSVPMIDITDSSTDDDREPETPIVMNSPPAKRKKYSSYVKMDANCLVQRNRGDSSVPYRNKSLQPSDEEVVERSEQRHLPLKRQLPFHCDDRPAKRSASQNSMIDLKQPSFKQSLVGSLFYPGRTSYGGAASQYVNQPNITERKEAHVTEVNSNDSMNMSHSSRRVMELLDQYSSPRRDALRIPLFDRSPHMDSSSLNSSVLSPHKTRELHVPSIVSLLRLKQRSRLMDTTNTARQIIASQSSTSDSNYTPAATSTERESSQLHSSSLTPASSTRLTEDMSSIIETDFVPRTPPAKLSIFQPVINISIKTPSSSNNNDYRFSTPTEVSSPPVTVFTPPIYTFGGPDPDVDINKRRDDFIPPVKNAETGTNKSEDWQCPDCWVINNGTKCPCCGAQKPANAYDKNAKCKICKHSYRQSHSEKCISCDKTPTTIAMFSPSPSYSCAITNPLPINRDTSKWTCNDCLVANEASAEKCVCCGGKSVQTAQKKAVIDLQNEWKCAQCSIKNKSSVNKCTGCGVTKLEGKQNKPTLSTNSVLTPISAVDSKVQNIVDKQKEKWECGSCMVRNDSNKTKCVCCETERPGSVKQIKSTFNFGTNAKTVDSNIQNIVNKQNEKWECGSCMVRNDSNKTKCACCDTERPGAVKQIKSTFSFGINTSAADSKVQTIVSKQNEKWECTSCLVRNDSNKIKCICCETERPGTNTTMKSTFNFGTNATSKFKFGIVPEEQPSNITKSELEKKDDHEQSETNNNILPKPLIFGMPGKASNDQADSIAPDNKNTTAPKIAFSFGIPKQISSEKPVEKTVDSAKEQTKVLPKVGSTTVETKPVENSLSGMFNITSQGNSEKSSTLHAALPSSLPATLPLTQPVSLPASVPTSLPTTLPATLPAAPPPALPTPLPPTQPAALPSVITVKTPEALGTIPQKKSSFTFSEGGTGLTNLFTKPDEPSPAPLSLFPRSEQTTTTNFFQKPATTTSASVPTVPAANPVFTFDANANKSIGSVQTKPKISFNFGNPNKSETTNSFTFKFGSTADGAGSKSFSLPSGPSVGANNLLSGSILSGGNALPGGNGLPDGNLGAATEQSHNPLRPQNDLGSSNIFGAPAQKDNVWSFNTSAPNLFGTNNNNNASNLPKPVFAFGSTSTPFNNSTPVFGSNVQPTQSMFGMPTQNTSTPQQSLFSSPAQNQPANNIFGSPQTASGPEAQLGGLFGTSNVSSGSTFGPTQPTPSFEATPIAQSPSGAFNFGTSQSVGVFGFGQQPQPQPQPQPQQQQQPYNFGAAAAGSPQVQFNMGNMASAGARRVRKAVRRNPR